MFFYFKFFQKYVFRLKKTIDLNISKIIYKNHRANKANIGNKINKGSKVNIGNKTNKINISNLGYICANKKRKTDSGIEGKRLEAE